MKDKVIALYKIHKKIAPIRRLLGLSHAYILKILREAGLKPKDKNFSYTRGSGENHPLWNGGISINEAGYVRIKAPDHPRAHYHGYVFEHILVMEKKLGRHLIYYSKNDPRNEEVHHINGIKTDNNTDNLELHCGTSSHISFEWKYNEIKFPQSKKSQIETPERFSEWKMKNIKKIEAKISSS